MPSPVPGTGDTTVTNPNMFPPLMVFTTSLKSDFPSTVLQKFPHWKSPTFSQFLIHFLHHSSKQPIPFLSASGILCLLWLYPHPKLLAPANPSPHLSISIKSFPIHPVVQARNLGILASPPPPHPIVSSSRWLYVQNTSLIVHRVFIAIIATSVQDSWQLNSLLTGLPASLQSLKANLSHDHQSDF